MNLWISEMTILLLWVLRVSIKQHFESFLQSPKSILDISISVLVRYDSEF